MKFSVSLAQIHLESGQPEANFCTASRMISEAHHKGSNLVLLPELWSSAYDLANGHRYASTNLELNKNLANLAQVCSLTIGGSYLEEESGKLYNTFLLIRPDESSPIKYRKLHLFRLMDEHRWLQPGSSIQSCQLPWCTIGMSICYDLRFPELFRYYALQGASIVLLVAEWPVQRIQHWKTLLRARAIENQIFIAAVNCVGQTGHETFGGSSAIISPRGETLAEGNETDEALLTTEIDLAQIDEARQTLPIFQDRRPELYGWGGVDTPSPISHGLTGSDNR